MRSYEQEKVIQFRQQLEAEGCLKYVITYRDQIGDRKSLIYENGQFFLCDGKKKTMNLPYPEMLYVLLGRLRDGIYPILSKGAVKQDHDHLVFKSMKKETQKFAPPKGSSECRITHLGEGGLSW